MAEISTCLTTYQLNGLLAFFSPQVGPSLVGGPTEDSLYKELSKSKIESLSGKVSLIKELILNQGNASMLADWLRSTADTKIPVWANASIGAGSPSPWADIATIVLEYLLDGSNETQRNSLRELAATITSGGKIAALESVSRNGKEYKFSFAYMCSLNGKWYVTSLYTARATIKEI